MIHGIRLLLAVLPTLLASITASQQNVAATTTTTFIRGSDNHDEAGNDDGTNLPSSSRQVTVDGRRSASCDETFPLADLFELSTDADGDDGDDDNEEQRGRRHHHHHRRRLVAIPDDETRQEYAPLCDDGRRIDIRQLNRCNGGSCFNEYYQQCTFECTWNEPSAAVTTRPTAKPTKSSVTANPVLLKLNELIENYRMTESVRSAIIKALRDILERNLGDTGLTITDVDWLGRLPGQPHSIPIEISAIGPSDVSDFALTYILEVLRENDTELTNYMKKLDGGDPFKNVGMVVETYDPNDIVSGPSDPPTISPTVKDTPEPVVTRAFVEVEPMEEKEEGGIPWWVWLLVVLPILCLICCWCFWWFRVDPNKENEENDQDDELIKTELSSAGAGTKRTRRDRGGVVGSSDAASRYSTRSRMTQSSARTKKATSIVSRSFTRKYLPEKQKQGKEKIRVADPTMAPVSVLPAADGFDPPQEVENALVMYSSSVQARDPTMYVDGKAQGTELKDEPDGLKVPRKKSMFAADAVNNDRSSARNRSGGFGNRLKSSFSPKKSLDMNMENPIGDDPMEYDDNPKIRRDPTEYIDHPNITRDDPTEYNVNRNRKEPEAFASNEVPSFRKKKKRKSSRKNSASSSSKRGGGGGDTSTMNKIRQSISWKRNEPLDIDFDMNDMDGNYYSGTQGHNHRAEEAAVPSSQGYFSSDVPPGQHHGGGDNASYAPSRSSKRNSMGRQRRTEGGSGDRSTRGKQRGLFSSLRTRDFDSIESIDV